MGDKVDSENNKEVVLAEYSYKTLHKLIKSGEYRWFRSTGRMTRKKWGRAGIFYGMLMDIDEKKKTDAKLLWRDTLADIMTQNLDSVYIILINITGNLCMYV